MEENKRFVSGFVTIVGRPNVGKSTLLNKLIGEKISIISNKPQTTRQQVRCIITGDDHQIIFIDTPGIHKPKHKLDKYMMESAESTFSEVDAILLMVEPNNSIGKGDLFIIDMLKQNKIPVILLINKVDQIKKELLLPIINSYKDLYDFKTIIPISASKGDNVNEVITEIKKLLPEGPKYFPEDMITDQPERVIVSEIIREKVLHLISDEIPHGVAIEIMSMKDREAKEIIDISANIFCEKDSHKGIIIGKNGEMLKRIGELAREEIERFVGKKVFLELWVKVKKDWRNNEIILKNLGFKL